MICAIIVHCFEAHKMQPSSRKALVAGIQMPLRYVDPSVCTLLWNPSNGLLFDGLKKEQPKKYLPLSLPLVHKLVSHFRQECFRSYADTLLFLWVPQVRRIHNF